MAVTGTITTKFVDEKGLDLGRQLVEKDYLLSVYPNLLPQFESAGLYLWGKNNDGQLGDATIVHRSSPIQTIATGTNWTQGSCGSSRTVAIKNDGTLWCWGTNYYGQLGDNTSVLKRSSPVQTVAGGNNWKQVACGSFHTAAIKTDGTLWLWGQNNNGELGDNTTTNKSSPVQTVTGGNNWIQAACGYQHTVAKKTDGTLWVWGINSNGGLGTNNTTSYSSPVQTVAGGSNWNVVSAGGFRTSAIKNDGTLWIWGINNAGQLGDNSTVNKSSPVQTIVAGTNWKQVSSNNLITAAVKTDGTLWIWGNNQYGYLGDNTITHRSSPVQTIAAGTNWKYTACGLNHISTIKTDGTLWTWGLGSDGQLGNNGSGPLYSRSSPIQTVIVGNTWKYIAGGSSLFTLAIRDSNY